MAETKKIRFLSRAGDPRSGVIIQPGTVTDFPAAWADRYIQQGVAELAEDPPKVTGTARTEKQPKGKGKK
jgi:hypothetical protein